MTALGTSRRDSSRHGSRRSSDDLKPHRSQWLGSLKVGMTGWSVGLALELRDRRGAPPRQAPLLAEQAPGEGDDPPHREAHERDEHGVGLVLAGAERRPAGLVEQG